MFVAYEGIYSNLESVLAAWVWYRRKASARRRSGTPSSRRCRLRCQPRSASTGGASRPASPAPPVVQYWITAAGACTDLRSSDARHKCFRRGMLNAASPRSPLAALLLCHKLASKFAERGEAQAPAATPPRATQR